MPGFFIKHFIKDMALAVGEAKDSGLELSVLELVLSHYRQLAEAGKGESGTQALFEFYHQSSNKQD